MATKTTNYGLTKPDGADFYDVDVQNSNMEIIDKQMKVNADDIKQLNSDYTIEYNDNVKDRGLRIVHSKNNLLLHGIIELPFDFESTYPICTIKKDGSEIQPKIDCGGIAIPIYDSKQNAVIKYNHDAKSLYPNSTLKKGMWLLSICISV